MKKRKLLEVLAREVRMHHLAVKDRDEAEDEALCWMRAHETLVEANKANKSLPPRGESGANAEALDAELAKAVAQVKAGERDPLPSWRDWKFDEDWLARHGVKGQEATEALSKTVHAIADAARKPLLAELDRLRQANTGRDKQVVADALAHSGLRETIEKARNITECPADTALVDWLVDLVAECDRVRKDRDRVKADIDERNVRIGQLEEVNEQRFQRQRQLEQEVEERSEDLAGRSRRWQEQVQRLERDLARAVEQREALRKELGTVKAELSGAMVSAADDVGHQAVRIGALQDELGRVRGERDALRVEAAMWERSVRQHERAQEPRPRLAERVDRLMGERDALRHELDSVKSDLDRLRLSRTARSSGTGGQDGDTIPECGWAKADHEGFPCGWQASIDHDDAVQAAQDRAPAYVAWMTEDGERCFRLYDGGWWSTHHDTTEKCCVDWLRWKREERWNREERWKGEG